MSTDSHEDDIPPLTERPGLPPGAVDAAYRGNLGTTYFPPPEVEPCLAHYPGDGESCRLPDGHAGAHTNLWEVWEA